MCRRHSTKGQPGGVFIGEKNTPFGQKTIYRVICVALAEMAGEQGRFWEFVHALHAQPRPPDRAGYVEILRSLGLDPAAAEARLENPEDPAVARVQRDEAFAGRLGVNATPSFVVLLRGERPFSANQRTLERVLNSPPVQALLAPPPAAQPRPATSGLNGK